MDNSSEDCYSSSADESLCDYLQTDHKDTEVYHRLAWVFDREQESESAYFRYITRFLAGKKYRQRYIVKKIDCHSFSGFQNNSALFQELFINMFFI